jgi:hypothetical protein
MSTVIITRTTKVTKTIRRYPSPVAPTPEWEQLEFDFVVS